MATDDFHSVKSVLAAEFMLEWPRSKEFPKVVFDHLMGDVAARDQVQLPQKRPDSWLRANTVSVVVPAL